MWLHEILIGHNRTATLTCIVKFSFSLLFNCICTFPVLFQISDLTWHVFDSSPICFTIIGNDLTDYFYFSVHLFNLLHATLTEVSIGLPLVKPLLPCLVSSHLSSSTIYIIFIAITFALHWNVVFISELLPTCQNYQKKVATKWEPCPKTCLKLRKSFQNELAGTTKLFEGLISLHFFSCQQ